LKAPHPFLTDLKVRQALALATDRQTIAQQLFGQEGDATSNTLTVPTIYMSKNTKIVYDLARANQLLDEAGYQRGPDGIRQKNGVRLQVVYQTSVNSLRQKEQEIIKAGWEKIGVAATLKSIDAGVFFSSSPGNTDTFEHFYADIEMYTTASDPFPNSYMGRFYSGNPGMYIAQKENDWAGINITRYVDSTYNAMFDQVQAELDPRKSIELWIKLNDRLVEQAVTIPIIDRKFVSGRANTLDVGQNMLPFDTETLNIADWRRTG